MILTYDTETTGFLDRKRSLSDPTQSRILQLGALLDFPDGREAMRLDVILAQSDLTQEQMDSWAKAQAVHHITPEISKKIGVNETTAIELFLDMIEVADVIVGHNIKGFDNDMITGTARRVISNDAFDPFAGKKLFDTMLAGTPVCRLPKRTGGLKPPKLTELHKHLFGVEFEGAHAAINDVLASRRCFYELGRRLNGATNSHENQS